MTVRVGWVDGHADVWGVFRDGAALREVVTGLAGPLRRAGVTAVCGVESRGFLLGGAVAAELGVGFVAVRKGGGLFPGTKVERDAGADYRAVRHRLRMQRAALGPGDLVGLVDGWIETGSQAVAVREMAEACGAWWAGVSVMVDQLADPARRVRLGPVHALLTADQLAFPEGE